MTDEADQPHAFSWVITMEQIRRGEPLSHDVIAYGLRGPAPVPREVREYLADFLENTAPSRGKPKQNWFETAIRRDYIKTTYELGKRSAKAHPIPGDGFTRGHTALLRTQEILADEGLNMSIDSIRDAVRGRKGWKGQG